VNVGWKQVDFPTLPPHDALVLSDSTLECIGGLPLYYRQWKENNDKGADKKRPLPPIYSTFPVVKMGQMTLYDLHAAICMDGGSPPFSLQDVDDIFTTISAIKYSHPQRLGPPSADPTLTITAHRAGHTVGGSFFVLQRLQDDTKVVITATYNIARELHLDSSTLVQEGTTPDVLVTRPGGPALRKFHELTQVPVGQRTAPLPHMLATQAQRNISDTVLSVLRREGNVLLPVDAASRSLELIFLLNQHWERNRLRSAYHLVWLGPMVPNTVDFARSQLEWMGAKLGQSFLDSQDGSKGGQHPWSLPNVHFLQSVNELQSLLQENPNPAAVVASGASLESGPARDVLLQWADNPDNAILMTDSSQALLRPETSTTTTDAVIPTDAAAGTAATGTATGTTEESDIIGEQLNPDEERSKWTTAGQLLMAWGQAKKEGLSELDSVNCDVPIRVKRALQGAELKSFLAREESARQAQIEEDKQKAMLREVELAKGQLRLGEDEKRTTVQAVPSMDKAVEGTTSIPSRPRKKSRFDQSLFLKFSKPLHSKYD
jgi:cleavage and polyadenylation specificity factor subunit 2